jgi:glutamate dehydrogenase
MVMDGDDRSALVERVSSLASAYVAADEAPGLAEFIRRFYADVSADDLAERNVEDLAGAARALWRASRHRQPGAPIIRAYDPTSGVDGWSSPYTVIEVVSDDMPFIVDSVTMAIERRHGVVQLAIHPIVAVRRARDGQLLGLATDEGNGADGHTENEKRLVESFVHIELDRIDDTAVLAELVDALRVAYADVQAATSDWSDMLAATFRVVNELASGPGAGDEEHAETRALMQWMADHHFTFLGVADIVPTTDDPAAIVEASALGILRNPGRPRLTPFGGTETLVISKEPERSRVHRDVYLDAVAIRSFAPDGSVARETRFLGLWTSSAYHASPTEIPVLRRKVTAVIQRAGYPHDSHAGKDLAAILETYPRDQLFQISVDELFDTSVAILQLQERKRVRLFLRADTTGQFVSALVFVPRDRYTTSLRLRVASILGDALHASESQWTVHVSDAVLARLNFVLRVEAGALANVNPRDLERAIRGASRSWSEALRDALTASEGIDRGHALARRWADAFPPAYQDDNAPETAVADVLDLDRLDQTGATVLRLEAEQPDGLLPFSVIAHAQHPLSEVMPILSNLGVRVIDEHPYALGGNGNGIDTANGPVAHLARFGIRSDAPGVDLAASRDDFEDAFAAVLDGEAESDAFGALVLGASLSWREVAVLRAYTRYLRQVGTLFSHEYIASVLNAHPDIARAIVTYFRVRFDPDLARPQSADAPPSTERTALDRMLENVTSLDDDRIIRAVINLVDATLRTNWFQRDNDGRPPSHIVFKLDPTRIPDVPRPVPTYEIFVYSPRVEGVHLRMGKVARGGLRWSDRREDFRTEVLGLVKAQTVKNTVIVPTGAKGGFVPKRLPPATDRDAWLAEGTACYRAFVGGLLDVTDNLVTPPGSSQHAGAVPKGPDRVVRYDDDDPYLVVAADKGTATFSDTANEIAIERGFWLGDAFASGGSAGYDHKAMGITARGAWESVRAHFRVIGIHPDSDAFTVVGIGDMSGDVFGNGMLLSHQVRLVAAFDHRHVFLDPDPDTTASYEERLRMFRLPRSSWADYDPTRISEGGGVFARTIKSVPITRQVRTALGLADDVAAMSPPALIAAILGAPVDLLWNGGIGTYVRASNESNADVGDKANDAVRIDAAAVRARVVAEGGNLGLTQQARIELARRGVLINTDAIDNSAGVDTSDHEVIIKILLADMIARGELAASERDALLAGMTDDVASLVLADNYQQNRALQIDAAESAVLTDVHMRYLAVLESDGKLDRAVEFLPSTSELAERKARGEGLCVPELAVVLAYNKHTIERAVLDSDVPDDRDVDEVLLAYFPQALRTRAANAIARHPLRREITATALVNAMVNTGGTTFAFRMMEETGAREPDVVRAQLVAWYVFDQHRFWDDVAGLDHSVAASLQVELYLESRRLLERATRWFLRHRRSPLPIAITAAAFTAGVARCSEVLPSVLAGDELAAISSRHERYVAGGVPETIAARAAIFASLASALDIVEIATEAERPIEAVAAVYAVAGDRLGLDWLRDRILGDLRRDDRWSALARSALRDDVYGEHRAITSAILARSRPLDDASVAFDNWATEHETALARATKVLTDVRQSSTYDLATLSVALRELRNLLT